MKSQVKGRRRDLDTLEVVRMRRRRRRRRLNRQQQNPLSRRSVIVCSVMT